MTTMDDDWRGEHLIRNVGVSPEDRGKENRRIVSTLWHKQRRESGEPTPGSREHSRFFKSLVRN